VRTEEIIVRKATKKDADGIIELLGSTKLGRETWNGNKIWAKSTLQYSVNKKHNVILVAEYGSSVIGFINCIVFHSFWECEKQAMITDFFVDCAYRGKGVGSKLLEKITKLADAQHISEIHVSIETDNARAKKLYGKYGFERARCLLEWSKETK
jgi:ribosomal protein S18 acetylase RimI-like enzyme